MTAFTTSGFSLSNGFRRVGLVVFLFVLVSILPLPLSTLITGSFPAAMTLRVVTCK